MGLHVLEKMKKSSVSYGTVHRRVWTFFLVSLFLSAIVLTSCDTGEMRESSSPTQTGAPERNVVEDDAVYFSHANLRIHNPSQSKKRVVKSVAGNKGLAVFFTVESNVKEETSTSGSSEKTYQISLYDDSGALGLTLTLPQEVTSSFLQNAKLISLEDGYALFSQVIEAGESTIAFLPVSSEGMFGEERRVGKFGKNAQIHKVFIDTAGNVFVLLSEISEASYKSYLSVFDSNGQELGSVQDEHTNPKGWSFGKNIFSDGKNVYVDTYSYDGTCKFRAVDMMNLRLKSPVNIDLSSVQTKNVQSSDQGIYITDWSGVYLVDIAENKVDALFLWKDCDVNMAVDQIQTYVSSPETVFVIFTTYPVKDDPETEVALMKKAQENPHAGKEILYLGGAGIRRDKSLIHAVHYYNLKHKTHRIEIFDYYNPQGSTTGILDYAELSQQITAGILGGKHPDIIVGNSFQPLSIFEGMNVLTDLKVFMKADKSFYEDHYYTNLLEMFRKEDHVYRVFPTFQVSGIMGEQSLLPTKSGWTFEEFEEVVETVSSPMLPMEKISREALLSASFITSATAFFNTLERQCEIDREQFAALLEYAKKYGSITDAYDSDNYVNPLEQVLSDELAMLQVRLSDVNSYTDLCAVFGEIIHVLGQPSVNGAGPVVTIPLSFGVMESSTKKAAAWDFIKLLLEEDLQESAQDFGAFPIMKRMISTKMQRSEILANRSALSGYVYNSFGDIMEYPSIPETEPLSEENAKFLLDLITGLNNATESDIAIMQILSEESASFFTDRQTADQTAMAVQNRIQAYLQSRGSHP